MMSVSTAVLLLASLKVEELVTAALEAVLPSAESEADVASGECSFMVRALRRTVLTSSRRLYTHGRQSM